MDCSKCAKEPWCPYLYMFNHDKEVGCIEFVDSDQKTYLSNTTISYKGEPYDTQN